jgi:anti-sigma B factor antagonist
MQVLTENHPTHTLARPDASKLDAAAAPALRNLVVDLANQGRFRVVLDLAGVDFVDSSGLGALIHMHKTLERQGRLVLCNVDAKVANLFKVTRLERVFTIAPTVAEAVARVQT